MNFRPLLILPPLVAAVIGFVWLNKQVSTPLSVVEKPQLAVRAMTLQPRALQATATGYGRVEAARDWIAVAQVQGRITHLVPDLAVGTIVEADQLLAQIDRTDYELDREKALANIASVEAQLRELSQQEANSKATLGVETRILEVAEAEYKRVVTLVERGTSTQAKLDSAQKVFLSQTSSVTNLKNTLALYPAKQQSLQATLSVRRAELAEAERSISKAAIYAPFRGRITQANAEVGQFTRTGDTLLTLVDISTAEITAEIQPSEFGPMMAVAFSKRQGEATVVDTSQAVEILKDLGLSAVVHLAVSGREGTWPAEIVRMRGSMDNDTGALGVVVRVVDPLVSRRAVMQPPLNIGTFVSKKNTTPPVDGLLTVPRTAVRFDDAGKPFVYLADTDNRLSHAPIELGPVIGRDILVKEGLTGGETLVLSMPNPPVIGMRVDPLLQDKGQ